MEMVKASIGGVFFVVVACVYWVGPTAWYSLKYHVRPENVYIDPKPTDCELWRAPIGLKGCHYERLVVMVSHWLEGNKAGPNCDSKPDGKGRTICPADERDRNVKHNSVFVTWSKKPD
jgi:hypothetical protein